MNIMANTYRQSIGTSQLLLQTIDVGLGDTRLVRVVKADNANQAEESSDEASEVEETLAGRDVGILLGTEDTEDFVILVHRLAKVALFLRIPPATVGVSVCPLDCGRVGVVVVLPRRLGSRMPSRETVYVADGCYTCRGSSTSAARRAGIWEKDARGAIARATWGRRRAKIR